MESVGIRELKAHLSAILRRVGDGEPIVVTQRGKPIARIVPVDLPEDLAQLLATGRAAWSGARFTPPREPVRLKPGSPPVSDAVSEDRR